MVKALLEHGADPSQTHWWRSPQAIARHSGLPSITDLLNKKVPSEEESK